VKFAIVGAGATGGFLGAHLARAGEDVTLVARGPNLQALRENGVTVRGPEGEFNARPRSTDDLAAAVAAADTVFLTVKAHAVTAIAPQLGAALGPEASLLTAQNGIPWWYFIGGAGPLEGTRLETVDPGGVIADSLDVRRVLACIVYPATNLVAPGVVEHVEGNRFSIGELDGARSERCQAISAALGGAGLKCPVQTRIRPEIWLKLLGNATLNPVSALTRGTLAAITGDERTRELLRSLMGEVDAVARAAGVEVDLGVDRRLEGAARVGEHKTSMLQDVEAGRPLEVEALVGSVVELGRLLEVPTPALEVVYTLTRQLSASLGS
jgi:2-dehydropantoate 2-reductase